MPLLLDVSRQETKTVNPLGKQIFANTAIMFSCMGKKPKKQEQNKQKAQQQEQRTVLGNSATTNKPAPNVAEYAMAPPPPTKKTLEPMGFRAGEAHCDIDVSYRRNSC